MPDGTGLTPTGPSNPLGRWAAYGLGIGVVVGIGLAALFNASRHTLSYYDEGVYYHQGVLWAQGQRPYTDYFVPQPPGILMAGAASYRCGTGLAGVRVLTWLCGLVVLYQTFWITRRSAQRCQLAPPGLIGLTAAALVVCSNRFVYTCTQAGTDMPSTCLVLAVLQVLLVTECRRGMLPGALLGLSTLIRLQPASFLPGIVMMILMTDASGRRIRTAALFVGGFILAFALGHGALALVAPGYTEGVFLFQMQRLRVGTGEKLLILLQFLGEPHVGFAAVAVGCTLASPVRAVRSLAWLAAYLVIVTTFSGNVLYLIYFLPSLPLLMTAASLVIASAARTIGGGPWPHFFAVLVAACGTGLSIKSEFLDQRRLDPIHRRYIEAVRAAPGAVLLTDDGRVAVAAGKRLVADYYATDPNALFQLDPERFRGWLRDVLPQADAVGVSPKFFDWLTSADARLLRDSGKPLIFESEALERSFDSKANRVPNP